MKNLKNLAGVQLLSKKQQKSVRAGYFPEEEPEPCGWPMCRNFFGRCSLFAC